MKIRLPQTSNLTSIAWFRNIVKEGGKEKGKGERRRKTQRERRSTFQSGCKIQ